jgi:hypothetical protein
MHKHPSYTVKATKYSPQNPLQIPILELIIKLKKLDLKPNKWLQKEITLCPKLHK